MRVFGKRLSIVGFNITFEVLDMVYQFNVWYFGLKSHCVFPEIVTSLDEESEVYMIL